MENDDANKKMSPAETLRVQLIWRPSIFVGQICPFSLTIEGIFDFVAVSLSLSSFIHHIISSDHS
jgi:hypothetical protein